MSREILIIEKAIDLFAKNGIEATSVQDITQACGISKGAFYLSFKSKEELLVAIIDYFMKQVITKNADVIGQDIPAEERLFQYYLLNLKIFYEYSLFITIYLREHIRSVNDEVAEKLNEYEKINDEALLHLMDEILGEKNDFRYDLVIMIKGLVLSYAGYILTHPQKYELEQLAQALVERTYLLAEHHRQVFITQELWDNAPNTILASTPTMETVEALAADLLGQYKEEALIGESLQLLMEEMRAESPRQAIIKGLVANLRPVPEMSWFIYCVEYVYRNMKAIR